MILYVYLMVLAMMNKPHGERLNGLLRSIQLCGLTFKSAFCKSRHLVLC